MPSKPSPPKPNFWIKQPAICYSTISKDRIWASRMSKTVHSHPTTISKPNSPTLPPRYNSLPAAGRLPPIILDNLPLQPQQLLDGLLQPTGEKVLPDEVKSQEKSKSRSSVFLAKGWSPTETSRASALVKLLASVRQEEQPPSCLLKSSLWLMFNLIPNFSKINLD